MLPAPSGDGAGSIFFERHRSPLPMPSSSLLSLLAIGLALLGGAAPQAARAEAAGSPDASYLAELVGRAHRLELASDPVWLALLHYEERRFLPGARSFAETRSFFAAPDGDRDPQAELDATLAAFFDAVGVVRDEEPAQCAFVARRHWLAERLEIDRERLPFLECEHYRNWRRGLGAAGLTLIFPEGFMNNPASMFGHTLLRLDVDREAGAEAILSYAVDFTANAGGDGGIVYVFKGIFGAYPGHFGINPYYQQLKRYADWENRDIWEYTLDVDAEGLDFMLMHLWELRGVAFPYWFFTKNCSYQLLRLIDIAIPELESAAEFPYTVIPVDTVRPLVRRAGLVTKTRYRPSPATELRHELSSLRREERRLAEAVAEGRIDPAGPELQSLEPARRAVVLDSAHDHLQYSFLAGRLERAPSMRLLRRILVARSKVQLEPDAPAPLGPVPVPRVRPDESHESARFGLSAGWRDGDGYLELRLRPSLHDLLDAEGGYARHMQIRFLDTTVRYYPGLDRVRLQELVAVEAVSLSPRGLAFRPIAWRLGTGLSTRRTPSKGGLRDSAVWRSDIGAGLAYDPHPAWLLYGLADLRFDAGPDLRSGVSFGVGMNAGVYVRTPVDRWKGHLAGEVTRFVAGDTTTLLRAKLEQRVRLTRNTALRVEASFNRIADSSWYQAGAGVDWHF